MRSLGANVIADTLSRSLRSLKVSDLWKIANGCLDAVVFLFLFRYSVAERFRITAEVGMGLLHCLTFKLSESLKKLFTRCVY